jgi:type I restriction enzyme M protein
MGAIEESNESLRGSLPRNYSEIENRTLFELIRIFDTISMDIKGDKFGKIYEYFLGKFAMAEGQGGGEFYTPTSIVRLIVEILEPNQGRILDPACGSGGMFVQSARFVENHHNNPDNISVYGMEKTTETVNLAKMNLAVHQLSGQIRSVNSYYEDPFDSPGKFDFVMANPPFNVDKIDKERIKNNTARYPLGMPKNDNGNFIWIQMFYGALNERGRAGFVMSNSAADARHSQQQIRQKLIESNSVDVMISVGGNFFYTVAVPCNLWFLDKNKKGTVREDKVLFINALEIYREIDRAHRDFTDAQIEFIANLIRMYRGQEIELNDGSDELLSEAFGGHVYKDITGLCKVVTIQEIKKQDWSLNPMRYVGVPEAEREFFDLADRLRELNDELTQLNAESDVFEERIARNVDELLR